MKTRMADELTISPPVAASHVCIASGGSSTGPRFRGIKHETQRPKNAARVVIRFEASIALSCRMSVSSRAAMIDSPSMTGKRMSPGGSVVWR